jgi:hypothetical protein
MDLFRYRLLLLSSAALASIGAGVAVANPLGGAVTGGTATIQGQGTNSVIINQASQNAIINWTTFKSAREKPLPSISSTARRPCSTA